MVSVWADPWVTCANDTISGKDMSASNQVMSEVRLILFSRVLPLIFVCVGFVTIQPGAKWSGQQILSLIDSETPSNL